MARVFPSWLTIHDASKFTPALTPGEEYLVEQLESLLDDKWSVYVQPHLNGDRPDVVAMNPNVGVTFFEVKDWNLDLYNVDSFDNWHVVTRHGRQTWVASPFKQVTRYRTNAINLLVPQIGRAVDEEPQRLQALKTAVYFHNSSGEIARSFKTPSSKYIYVFGYDDFPNGLQKIIPDFGYSSSKYMKPNWAKELAPWLLPPRHEATHGRLPLSREQRQHATPSQGFHRLRGVAGSGKSLVVAHRAAANAQAGKRVLVLCFNITLVNYLLDLVKRAPYNFDPSYISIRYFHDACIWINDKLGSYLSAKKGDEEVYFEKTVPNKTINALESYMTLNGRLPYELRFDSVLIDEGQDFTRSYYEVARILASASGREFELFMTADYAQNIYNREYSWLEDMRGTGFRGAWGKLAKTYRMRQRFASAAWRFAQACGLDTDLPEFDVNQVGLLETLVYYRTKDIESACRIALGCYEYLRSVRGVHPQDTALLVPDHSTGVSMATWLNNQGNRVNHVFSTAIDERQRHKKGFWMGQGGIKMSTIHSFKGWEINSLILIANKETLANINTSMIIYVALTRAIENIYIISTYDIINIETTEPDNIPLEILEYAGKTSFTINWRNTVRSSDEGLDYYDRIDPPETHGDAWSFGIDDD